jgi:tryptophanase
VAEVAAAVKSRADEFGGYRITYAPEVLRHFTARFEPVPVGAIR